MSLVTESLANADEEDVRAIAQYVASLMQQPGSSRPGHRRPGARRVPANDLDIRQGAAIFNAACLSCHDGSRPLPYGGITFDRSTALNASNPRDIINVVLHGLPAADGRSSPIMPGFNGAISDVQLHALLRYLRLRFSEEPAWVDVERHIRRARRES
jgi:mono/diheme cytochrome c family protein